MSGNVSSRRAPAPVRFRSDVIGGRVVVFDFVTATSTTERPAPSGTVARLQDRRGERRGQGLRLVPASRGRVGDEVLAACSAAESDAD